MEPGTDGNALIIMELEEFLGKALIFDYNFSRPKKVVQNSRIDLIDISCSIVRMDAIKQLHPWYQGEWIILRNLEKELVLNNQLKWEHYRGWVPRDKRNPKKNEYYRRISYSTAIEAQNVLRRWARVNGYKESQLILK